MQEETSRENIGVILIDPDGVDNVEHARETEKCHGFIYERLQERVPDILKGYTSSLTTSSGFELANYCAASNNVVIWPTNVNDDTMIIVTLPSVLTEEQWATTQEYLGVLLGHEVFVSTARFKKPNRSTKVIQQTLYQDGDPEEAIEVINNFASTRVLHDEEPVLETNREI